MPEIKHEVRTFAVALRCDVEGCPGEMVPTGEAKMTSPPKYVHQCNFCGASATSGHRYPRLEYEYLEADENLNERGSDNE